MIQMIFKKSLVYLDLAAADDDDGIGDDDDEDDFCFSTLTFPFPLLRRRPSISSSDDVDQRFAPEAELPRSGLGGF